MRLMVACVLLVSGACCPATIPATSPAESEWAKLGVLSGPSGADGPFRVDITIEGRFDSFRVGDPVAPGSQFPAARAAVVSNQGVLAVLSTNGRLELVDLVRPDVASVQAVIAGAISVGWSNDSRQLAVLVNNGSPEVQIRSASLDRVEQISLGGFAPTGEASVSWSADDAVIGISCLQLCGDSSARFVDLATEAELSAQLANAHFISSDELVGTGLQGLGIYEIQETGVVFVRALCAIDVLDSNPVQGVFLAFGPPPFVLSPTTPRGYLGNIDGLSATQSGSVLGERQLERLIPSELAREILEARVAEQP